MPRPAAEAVDPASGHVEEMGGEGDESDPLPSDQLSQSRDGVAHLYRPTAGGNDLPASGSMPTKLQKVRKKKKLSHRTTLNRATLYAKRAE